VTIGASNAKNRYLVSKKKRENNVFKKTIKFSRGGTQVEFFQGGGEKGFRNPTSYNRNGENRRERGGSTVDEEKRLEKEARFLF